MEKHFTQPIGISAYAAYIPHQYIRVDDIHEVHHPQLVGQSNYTKSVPDLDEDTGSFSLQICNQMTQSFPHIDYSKLGAIYVGSESHPYAVKPTGTILAQYFNISKLTTANLEFACKAGTAGLQIIASEVLAQTISAGLAIGVDIAQAHPGDVLETTAGAGGAGFLLSSQPQEIIANLLYTTSITSDTPDFWRRPGQSHPQHMGRFTGSPAYHKHVSAVTKRLLEISKLEPQQVQHTIFHSPNPKFPNQIANQFKFKNDTLIHNHLFPHIGNAYAGSTMLSLAYALDQAKPNEYIFLVSYGSGAGSDGFIFQTTENISKYKNKYQLIQQLENRKQLTYGQYLKHHHII